LTILHLFCAPSYSVFGLVVETDTWFPTGSVVCN
jgi:hypothetical protein